MTFTRYSEYHPNDVPIQCKCNYCGRSFLQSDILIEDGTDKEYCPECLTFGFIMELRDEE